MWIALLWAGWTFVFVGAETALIDTTTAGFISRVEQMYFTGHALFTLGNGGFAP